MWSVDPRFSIMMFCFTTNQKQWSKLLILKQNSKHSSLWIENSGARHRGESLLSQRQGKHPADLPTPLLFPSPGVLAQLNRPRVPCSCAISRSHWEALLLALNFVVPRKAFLQSGWDCTTETEREQKGTVPRPEWDFPKLLINKVNKGLCNLLITVRQQPPRAPNLHAAAAAC